MTDLYWETITIVLCVIFSALFSACETALTTLPAIKIQQMLDTNRPWFRALLLWQRHPNRVLATVLIGNNLVNITASVLATDLATAFFPGEAIPLAIGVMTLILLVVGEITPKTFGRTFPTAVAVPTVWVLTVFYALFFPFTYVLGYFIRGLISLAGVPLDEAMLVTEKDLEYVVRMGADSGAFDKDQENLFKSVIEFSDTLARQIMVPRTDMVAIPLDSPYEKVVKIAAETELSRLPVYDQSIDKMVGVFHVKSLITPPTPEERADFLRKRMRPPVFVPESKKISEILKLFQAKNTHIAIVVNEFGGTEGLVTLEDVVEELLGEIRDEFDLEEPRLVELPAGGYLADARIDLDELEEALAIRFPEERDYESLGGFLMSAAGTVPMAGWQYAHGGYAFAVTEADANRVIKVQIVPLPKQPLSAEEDGPDANGEPGLRERRQASS